MSTKVTKKQAHKIASLKRKNKQDRYAVQFRVAIIAARYRDF